MDQRKLKVVFFTRKPRALGNFSVETYFAMVAKSLEQEFEVSTVVMPFESKGLFPRLFNAIYCRYKQGDINHITGDIHYVATFLERRKTILTVLDCGMLQQTTGIKRAILKFFWFTLPVRKVRYITAISTATKNELLRQVKFSASRIEVIYVCVNELFQPTPKPDYQDGAKVKLLQIGTAPNKNISRLADALKGLYVELTIIGKISEELSEKLQKNNIDTIIKDYKLSDQEILEEYQQTDILAFVSTIEGFGMPIVEANKVGRIVVTSNVSSMPEIAGNAAIFVNPNEVSSIRNGFEQAITLLKAPAELIEKGKLNAHRFELEHISNAYAKLYYKIAGRKRKINE